MAQISDLVAATSVSDADELLVRQGGEDKRVSKTNLVSGIAHENLSGTQSGRGHAGIHPRVTTVAGIASGVFSIGDNVVISDRFNHTAVISAASTANGYNIFDAGAGKSAIVDRLSIIETNEPVTFFVDPTLGTDAWGYGLSSGSGAYKTIQFAYDTLPQYITHQQTIQLADGTYSENYLPATQSVALPRPAILFARGKFIAARTQKNGNEMEGGVVIKGNATTPSNVVVQPTNTYSYGIYNAQGQIALQNFVIRPHASSTLINNLLIAHRMDSRIHSLNVSLDGVSKSITDRAMLTESGGEIEFTTTFSEVYVKNANILVSTLTAGDRITISGNYKLDAANTGVIALSNTYIKFAASGISGQTFTNCSTACISAQFGGYVTIRGNNDSNHTLIDGAVIVDAGSVVDLVWTDVTGNITNTLGTVKLDNSDYQKQFVNRGGDVWLRSSDSFISPATKNTDVIPLSLTSNTRLHKEGTNNILGSGDGPESFNPLTLSYTANSQVLSITDGVDAYRVFGNGANRTGCSISATDVADGRTIRIDGDSWGVQFVSGAAMDLAASFYVGNGTGQYTGAVLTMRAGKWRVNSIGQVRP
jgi:hypothetical protein